MSDMHFGPFSSNNALNHDEKRFKALSDNIPGAIYEYGFYPDGTCGFTYLSASIEKMFGIPVQQFMQSIDHVVPEDRERLFAANRISQHTNEPFYFEGRIKTPEGKIKWHAASSSFSFQLPDGCRIFTGIILDISERKFAEDKIVENEARLRSALIAVGDNVWEHNFLNNETIFSGSIFKMLGYQSKNGAENVDLWWKGIYPDDRWKVEETDIEYRKGLLENHSLIYRMYHADGSIKWIRDRGVVIEKDATGIPVRIIGTHTDMTREKELEEFKIAKEQERKKEIYEAVSEAREKERRGIAHELHENIGQVLAACKMMLAQVLENETQVNQVVPLVLKNMEQAIREIRSLSDDLSTDALDLIGLPQAVNDLLQKANNEGTTVFFVSADKFDSETAIDSKKILVIYRIIQKHVLNILKHSEAPEAKIKLATKDNSVLVEIIDNGKGFDMATVKKGLGFTNIFGKVEHHHGTIELESQPGRGCRLKIIIPVKTG